MIVIPGNTIVYCDVDDTIAMWSPTQQELEDYGIDVTCPASMVVDEDGHTVNSGSWTQKLVPHKKHIEQLKKHKMRGHTVVVWSAGGYDWAETVVRTFNLENFVDLVISKPTWVMDDLPSSEFMPKSKWMKDE